MKNMKMSQKLLVSFGITILLTAILGIIAIAITRNIDAAYSVIIDNDLPGVYEMGEINTNIQGERSNMRAMLVYIYRGDSAMVAESRANVEANSAQVQRLLTSYEDTLRTDEGRRLYNDAVSKYTAFAKLRDEYLSYSENMDAQGSFERIVSLGSAQTEAINAFSGLVDFRINQANTESAAATLEVNTGMAIVIGVLVAVLVISVAFAIYLARIISRPLVKMQAVLNQVGTTGSMEFSAETMAGVEAETGYRDEMGTSLAAFHRMMLHFVTISQELKYVAEGDLTHTVKTLSPQDTMGNAINNLIANLNDMFGEINASSSEVSSASKQIADGAQTLAQGSTQQAAAVQQLSASIGEVAQSIQIASESARQAAHLAGDIKAKAQTGTDQMQNMMQAVQEINEASQNIGRIIAVIDKIAFQTNILALNASVEAARAGQHGRGFAVVAEEVRSLATQSAAAARDTGALIENSIAKAELGVKIAAETSESLDQIVGGINESSVIVTEIARSAEDQANAITQINTGIDQVAQVVHHNSATAQQSAAASQELSGQSTIMQQLVGRFKLREQSSPYALPQYAAAPHRDRHDLRLPQGNLGKY